MFNNNVWEGVSRGFFGSLLEKLCRYFERLLNNPNSKTVHVIILGSTASGKTTLWHQLQNIQLPKDYVTTSEDWIDSFIVKINGKTRKVSHTKDLGGNDMYVEAYDEIIKKDGTFIYFLVDLTRLEETRAEIRARLLKIYKILQDKKLNECGIRILATHHDEYLKTKNTDAKCYVNQILKIRSIQGFSKGLEITPINLLCKEEVDIIKKQITSD